MGEASVGGAFVVPGALDAATVADWRAAIDAHPAWAARRGDGFLASASSLRLSAVASLDADAVVAAAWRSPVAAAWTASFVDAAAIAVDACWVRRQYAPRRAPAGHAPHAWHQDGALGCSFDAASPLLAMLTCWIALDDCGDAAPGLELASTDARRPLAPAALAGFQPTDACRPTLQAGDALVFAGHVVHRTHVTAQMTRDRTSLELRFVPHRPGGHCSRAGRLRRLPA